MQSPNTTMKNPQKDAAFLIEGSQISSNSPEVQLSLRFASKLGCRVFDSIHSFDEVHMARVYSNASVEKQKLIVVHVYMTMTARYDEETIFNELILKPFQLLQAQKKISELPDFLTKFSDYFSNSKMDNLIFEVSKKYPDGEQGEAFFNARQQIDGEITEISNQVSREFFIKFLKENQSLNVVFGLIGSAHLSFIDEAGKVIDTVQTTDEDNNVTYGHRYLKLNIDGREIDVYLFGGKHKNLDTYNKMRDFISKSNYNFSELKPSQSTPDDNFFKAKRSDSNSTFTPTVNIEKAIEGFLGWCKKDNKIPDTNLLLEFSGSLINIHTFTRDGFYETYGNISSCADHLNIEIFTAEQFWKKLIELRPEYESEGMPKRDEDPGVIAKP